MPHPSQFAIPYRYAGNARSLERSDSRTLPFYAFASWVFHLYHLLTPSSLSTVESAFLILLVVSSFPADFELTLRLPLALLFFFLSIRSISTPAERLSL